MNQVIAIDTAAEVYDEIKNRSIDLMKINKVLTELMDLVS